MASLDKMEGNVIDGVLLVLLVGLAYLLFEFSKGGGTLLALQNGLRSIWRGVDSVFASLVTSLDGTHIVANTVGAIAGTDSTDAGSSLGGASYPDNSSGDSSDDFYGMTA